MATPLSANQVKYLQNLAAGKTETGAAANAGQASWAKSQLAAGGMSATQANASPATPKVATPTATPSVTPMSAAVAKPVSAPVAAPTYNEAPQTNYGGKTNPYNEILFSKKQYDAGNTAWAANNAKQYYGALSADEAAKVQGMNTQQLIDYIGGMNANPANTAAQNAGQTSNGGYYPLSQTQIQTEAQAQLDRERAALQTAANQRLADLKSNFQYSNQLLQDNRVLEDQQINRTLNPFSGRTSYDKAMVNRGRGIDDNNRTAQFNTDVAAVQEDLYNFDKLAPERQQQVMNELTRIERQYGIDVAGLTGNFGGQRTLAGQQLDWGQTVDKANLTGTYNGQKTAAQANADREYNLTNTQVMAQLTGRLPDGTKTTAQQQIELANLWQVAEQTGKIPDQLATMYGIPKGTETQAAKQFAITSGQNQQQIDNQTAGVALDYQQYQNPNTTPKDNYSGLTSNQIYDAIKTQYTEPVLNEFGEQTGTSITKDPEKRKQMITQILQSSKGMPDAQREQIAASIGITNEEWKAVTGHAMGEQ